VQFDRTLIAVRERSVFDILDLALQVFRIYLWPLTITMCLGVIPLAIVNHFLTLWMVQIDPDAPLLENPVVGLIRFVWTAALLVVIEAPLASAFTTSYLGKALFLETPVIRDVVREVFPCLPRVAWCHLLLRGVLPAMLLVLAVDHDSDYSFAELLLTLLFLVVLLRRATAPFLNEIMLLERTPLGTVHPHAMTAQKRSIVLHGSNPASLINLSLVTSAVAVPLTLTVFGTLLCLKGIFLDDWTIGVGMFIIGTPLSMWITAEFLTVVRFLAYLDLRIRHEGWEVELRMRAEGSRLTGQIS
jgi:hypothetical protein